MRAEEKAVYTGAVAAVGMFDGVHLGHRRVLAILADEARKRGLRSIVLSFASHPLAVISPEGVCPGLLCTSAERCRRIAGAGINSVELLDFTQDMRAMTGREFLIFLKENYGVEALVVGFNNHFGSDRLDAAAAAALTSETGIEIIAAPEMEGLPGMSSTAVRRALEEGDMRLAAKILGRPFALRGTVVSGKHIGHTIGFPTANLEPECPGLALPASGVYAVDAVVDGKTFRGVTNIGCRPTVADAAAPSLSIETHIIGYSGEDLYGRGLELRFIERLRNEKRFDSLDALRRQIASDIARAIAL